MRPLKILIFCIFAGLVFFIMQLGAQTLTVKAGTVCTDSLISVPVDMEHVQGVRGFKLRLRYNKTQMFYTGYTLLNSSLNTLTVTDDVAGGQVSINYSSDSTLFNLSAGTVLELHFGMTTFSSTLLVWDTVYFWNQALASVPFIQVYGAAVSPPLITLQPAASNSCAGQGNTAQFKIQAVGTMHTYRWQESVNGGSTWSNLSDGVVYSGTLTPDLIINNPVQGMHNNLYRCHLSGYCELFSDAVPLEIMSNILLHPDDETINAGGTAVFESQGSGTSPTYLWEVSTDGGNTWSSTALFPAVTTPVITLSGVPQHWNGYRFRCQVGGACAPPVSPTQVATLNVGPAGIISPEENMLKVYPNPATHSIYFELPGSPNNMQLTISDINGRVVYTDAITGALQIPVSGYIRGVYFYRIESPGSGLMHYGKFVLTPQ